MKRTAQSIEERKAAVSGERTRNKSGNRRGMHPNSKKQLRPAPPWPKGKSANPGGKPGCDLAAMYARRFFERDPDAIALFKQMTAELKGFNAYAFGVLGERAYGKMRDHHELTGTEGGPVEIIVKLVKP